MKSFDHALPLQPPVGSARGLKKLVQGQARFGLSATMAIDAVGRDKGLERHIHRGPRLELFRGSASGNDSTAQQRDKHGRTGQDSGGVNEGLQRVVHVVRRGAGGGTFSITDLLLPLPTAVRPCWALVRLRDPLV